MNLRDLQYVVAVAELRNFSAAAERCHVSQPTLSNQIRKLEEYLGVQLFERTNKRVLTTEIGEEIISVARRILGETATIQELARHAHDPLSGTFRLGAFPTLSTYIFPPLVPKLKEALPRLKLILVEEKTAELIGRLKSGALDAALLALPVEEEFLTSKVLFDDPFYLAVPEGHALTKHKRISQQDLAGQSLLLLEEGHCLRDQALEVCHTSNATEEQDMRATSLETLRQMVRAGTGITFMPKIAIQVNEKGIRYLPFVSPAPCRTIGLVCRKTSRREQIIATLASLLIAIKP